MDVAISLNLDKVEVSTPFIRDADVAALAEWPKVVAALADAYAKPINPAMVPPRTMARGDGFWLRSLCAVSPSGEYMGCKLIAASPKIKRASYLISLFKQETMELAALVDGNRITDLRTAATAVVAVNAVKPDGVLRVGIIGSGSVARNMLSALLAVREVSLARVFSPTPSSREKFAANFRDENGLAIEAADSPQAAIRDVDVVMCAARSRDESPVLLGEWLRPGMIVLSIGSTLPEQREVDSAAMARADLIVADMPEEVLHETGDALVATRDGVDVAGKMVGLDQVVSGQVSGRRNPSDIVIYKSVGTALQDVVTAEMLLREALSGNRYQLIPAGVVTIDR
ncbi:ornithine cyclodeaminase family protein [Pseudomonas lalucatii]|uniref:Ornithine cyclodeaminase family protein n=1 Tax=Pseudomonas lalucatii TaxID=1424203 RepID=A0ABS5Q5Q1_9PSED|nr:ornithine cyclodeaminase family protein [Pseudomonas lalucatii]MBS7663631.1 ornithine cyclodeaminase family protein [Pseudomonas lalucatii]